MLTRSISGIRGLADSDLSPEFIRSVAAAAHQLMESGVIFIGRDSRRSGRNISDEIIGTLLELGRDVIECGIAPTPTIQFMVSSTDAAGGLVITASHNPSEWNGLKFISSDGTFFGPELCSDLFKKIDNSIEPIAADRPGMHLPDQNSIQRHIIHIAGLKCIDVKAIRSRNFSIVVDAVNGAGSDAIPHLLESLGCNVIMLNCDSDLDFPRPPEPLPENITDLCSAVIEHNADAGFALDPDGDRLAVVSDKGEPLSEEYTLVMAADGFLSAGNSTETLVTNLSTTIALEKTAHRYGAAVERTPVGEIHVVNAMKASGSPLGGEGNGGVILAENHFGRDSLAAAALVLNRMAQSTEPISGWFSELPQFRMVKDRIELGDTDSDELFSKAEDIFFDADIDRQDGLKFTWDDRWIHLRTSNTEPILRIYAEGRTFEEARELVDKIQNN